MQRSLTSTSEHTKKASCTGLGRRGNALALIQKGNNGIRSTEERSTGRSKGSSSSESTTKYKAEVHRKYTPHLGAQNHVTKLIFEETHFMWSHGAVLS